MADEFDGLGGSYVADPKTGKRTLVERTEEFNEPGSADAAPTIDPAVPEAPAIPAQSE